MAHKQNCSTTLRYLAHLSQAFLLKLRIAYCQYLGKCVYPTKLAVFYPYPVGQVLGRAALAGVLLTGVTIAVGALWRRRPYLVTGWLWYLGTLVPVIGLVQVGEQSMADRYSYMPLVGVFVMLAWAVGASRHKTPTHYTRDMANPHSGKACLLIHHTTGGKRCNPPLLVLDMRVAVNRRRIRRALCLGPFALASPSSVDPRDRQL